jgi:hypothetical protein
VLALTSAGAFAASESDVNVDGARQTQSGSRNKQQMDVGNAKAGLFQGAKSHVVAKNVSQTQSGSRNNQGMNLGNAE